MSYCFYYNTHFVETVVNAGATLQKTKLQKLGIFLKSCYTNSIMTMTSVKNKMGEAMINAGSALTAQGEKLSSNSVPPVSQSILHINLAAPKDSGIHYRRSTQEIRFR